MAAYLKQITGQLTNNTLKAMLMENKCKTIQNSVRNHNSLTKYIFNNQICIAAHLTKSDYTTYSEKKAKYFML